VALLCKPSEDSQSGELQLLEESVPIGTPSQVLAQAKPAVGTRMSALQEGLTGLMTTWARSQTGLYVRSGRKQRTASEPVGRGSDVAVWTGTNNYLPEPVVTCTAETR
jgi:hypothetical protein